MSKKFSASDWFLKESINASQNIQQEKRSPFSEFIGISDDLNKPEREILGLKGAINLGKCFIPGWHGESLISKSVNRFNKCLDALHQDARNVFLKNTTLPLTLRQSIFDDFISYSEHKACLCHDLNENNFWQALRDDKSPYRKELDQFIEVFALRAAVVYFFKLRFILLLSQNYYKSFDVKYAFNPNAFFTIIFQKGGQKELNTKAFSPNAFSWYRPSDTIENFIKELTHITLDLSITEITKHISQRGERILASDTSYSHSLSHKNFGLFLNTLLLNFPKWQKRLEKKPETSLKKQYAGMEVLSCKFAGDYLESLSQSHWLAQENNSHLKWDEILCSDFKSTDFTTGQYMKLLNELQFLTFLSSLAIDKGIDPAKFTSDVVKGHFYNRKSNFFSNDSLPIAGMDPGHSTYDRIILNISHYPKNNSQHHLINKIQEQTKYVKANGQIFVISSKKLFVPSQKNKIDGLLTGLKLDMMITLDNLKGKGEIGSYLYIFSKRHAHFQAVKESTKETCFTFRFCGELETFHQFAVFTDHLNRFFEGHANFAPSMYQKEIDNSTRFEFFQDAIFEGRLIHSHSKDSSQITHPHFFKSLLNSCKTFDYYFGLSSVNQSHQEEDSLNLLDKIDYNSTPEFVVIVDKRNDNTTKLEFIPYSSLDAKIYHYGVANCSYFGLHPKIPGISLGSVQDFFTSTIGQQIIDLSFGSDNRKIKATLEKLLAPNYFENHRKLPASIAGSMDFLGFNSNKILEIHPQELKKKFNDISLLLPGLAKDYSADTLSLVSNFKRSLEDCLFYLNQGKGAQIINFNNPMFHQPLLLAPNYSLYPDNNDVYIHFENTQSVNLLHAPLSGVKRKFIKTADFEGPVLELYVGKEKIISLHSEENMILFLEFILQNVEGAPISKILQGIKVPSLQDLNNIINSIKHIGGTIQELFQTTQKLQEKLINSVLLESR